MCAADRSMGQRPLRIKYLQDHYGSVLDTTETVGDIFDDRTGGVELNSTSIVRVVRFPPNRGELNDPQRFGSIMPESIARPQKRLLSNTQSTVRSKLGEMAIPEDLGLSEMDNSYDRAVKRQRLEVATASRRFDPDRPIRSRERDRGETPQRRLSPVRQASSSHFVEGSLRPLAPRRKHEWPALKLDQFVTDSLGPSPYGTPTSLSMIDRSNQISSGTAKQDGIPDSPPGRTNLQSIVDLEEDDTKSESPDLGRSLYDVPLSQAGTPAAGTELPSTKADEIAVMPAAVAKELITETVDEGVPASFTNPAVLITKSVVPLSQNTQSMQPIELRTPQPPTVAKDYTGSLTRPKQRSISSLPRNPLTSVSKAGKELYDMYDPIETDPEDSQKQQDPSSARRANVRSKEIVQLPPFNNAKESLTNGEMRPSSVAKDESLSKFTNVHVGDKPFHPVPKNIQQISENTNLQAPATKERTLMAPPKAALSHVIEKDQQPSLESLSQFVEVVEILGDARVNHGRLAGDAFRRTIQVQPRITMQKECQLPEKQSPAVSLRSMQPPKKEAPQERLDRKRKREEAGSLGVTNEELEQGAATLEAKNLALQPKGTGNLPRQRQVDGAEAGEKKEAERQRIEEVQVKRLSRSSAAKEVREPERIEEKTAKETTANEQEIKVLEKDAKRSKREQTTKPNGVHGAAKQTDTRSVTPRTIGRNDGIAVKNHRAELAMQQARESPTTGRLESSTPLSSSGTQEPKAKWSTPFYPGSRGSRSSSLSIEYPNPVQETPLKATKVEGQPPLTSALRKSPNTLRRSVSLSWANPIAPAGVPKHTESVATAQSSNGDKGTGSTPRALTSVAASHTRQSSVEITRTSSASSVGARQKKSRDPPKKSRDPPKKPSTYTKKQTTLDIKRDVKQKGRVVDPPSPPKPVVEEAEVISSDSEGKVSTFFTDSDDDVQETYTAKAGPSSKSKAKSDAILATAKAVITPKTPPDSQVDVTAKATVERATRTIENGITSRQAKAVTTAKAPPESQGMASHQTSNMRATPSTLSAISSQKSDATKDQSKASSRSPAQYVSSSLSSSSGASAKSDFSATSSSLPDIAPEPSSQAPMERKSTPVYSRSSSHTLALNHAKSTSAPARRLSSQSSTRHSTQQTQTTEAANVTSALDQQLQREARQFSEPAQVQVKCSPPMTRSQAPVSKSQTKATPAATPSEYQYTMSGPRPANIRFPSLTKLKNNPPKYDPKEHIKQADFMFSQKRSETKPVASSQPNGVKHDDESSSDSDDESGSSSDNDGEKPTRNAFSSPIGSQLSKKSDGKNAKGISSLLRRRFFIHW